MNTIKFPAAEQALRDAAEADAFLRGAEMMREVAAKACDRRAEGHRNAYSRYQIAYERESKWCATAIRETPLPEPKP